MGSIYGMFLIHQHQAGEMYQSAILSIRDRQSYKHMNQTVSQTRQYFNPTWVLEQDHSVTFAKQTKQVVFPHRNN